jgi:hypothetical protein
MVGAGGDGDHCAIADWNCVDGGLDGREVTRYPQYAHTRIENSVPINIGSEAKHDLLKIISPISIAILERRTRKRIPAQILPTTCESGLPSTHQIASEFQSPCASATHRDGGVRDDTAAKRALVVWSSTQQ